MKQLILSMLTVLFTSSVHADDVLDTHHLKTYRCSITAGTSHDLSEFLLSFEGENITIEGSGLHKRTLPKLPSLVSSSRKLGKYKQYRIWGSIYINIPNSLRSPSGGRNSMVQIVSIYDNIVREDYSCIRE